MSMRFVVSGRLTKDPEMETRGQYTMAKITVAVTRSYKNSQGDYDSDFHNMEIWGKRAEHVQKFLRKGSLVEVFGDTENNNYEKDGKRVYGTVHKVKEIRFLADYGDKANSNQNNQQGQQAPYNNQQAYGQQNAYQNQNPQQGQYANNQGQQSQPQQPYGNQGQGQYPNNQGQQAYPNQQQGQYPNNQMNNQHQNQNQGQGQPLDINDEDLPF